MRRSPSFSSIRSRLQGSQSEISCKVDRKSYLLMVFLFFSLIPQRDGVVCNAQHLGLVTRPPQRWGAYVHDSTSQRGSSNHCCWQSYIHEIMHVLSRLEDKFIVRRGARGTVPVLHPYGSRVSLWTVWIHISSASSANIPSLGNMSTLMRRSSECSRQTRLVSWWQGRNITLSRGVKSKFFLPVNKPSSKVKLMKSLYESDLIPKTIGKYLLVTLSKSEITFFWEHRHFSLYPS